MTTHSPVDVELTVRGGQGELTLVGSTVDAAPSAVGDLVALARALTSSPDLRDLEVHLAADHPVDHLDPVPEAVADELGLTQVRDLYQLRRPLPVAADDPARRGPPPDRLRLIDLSDGSGDADAWVRVNNRAFAAHADQGHESRESLAERLAADEVDAAGFLVLDDPDRPGELAGSCWTIVHPPTDVEPELGEIYVIGVDPSQHGKGLGTTLVIAGLDHLAGRGVATAMLYVDADNVAARALYDRLGFVPHHRRRVYTAPEAPASAT